MATTRPEIILAGVNLGTRKIRLNFSECFTSDHESLFDGTVSLTQKGKRVQAGSRPGRGGRPGRPGAGVAAGEAAQRREEGEDCFARDKLL